MMAGRIKRPLGDIFGLSNFGVNMTVVPAGSVSALRHAHSLQDEFVYVVSGVLMLHTDEGETELTSGMCAGFKAGSGIAHRLVNRSDHDAVYLEVGDRSPGDQITYPDDDLIARSEKSVWAFVHKNGAPYCD